MSPRLILIEGPRFTSAPAGPPSIPQGVDDDKALDFDGSTEYLANDTEQSIGIANAWTVGQWLNFSTDFAKRIAFRLRANSGNTNRIEIAWAELTSLLNITLHDSAGTKFKDYKYNNDAGFSTGAGWEFFVLTWDGTTLTLYRDASVITADTLTTDNSGTMTDTNRTVNIANRDIGGWEFSGRIHSTFMVSEALTSAIITDIYNGGAGGVVDLREVQGLWAQTQVDALEHYWRHGFNSGDIGEDLGNASTLIDVGNNAANITSADIVTDSPT